MLNDLIYNEMIEKKADGVDFTPLFSDCIIVSYTKEQWIDVNSYPRSNRKYWKLKRSGKKVYCT